MIWLVLLVCAILAWRIPLIRMVGGFVLLCFFMDMAWHAVFHVHPDILGDAKDWRVTEYSFVRDNPHGEYFELQLMESLEDCRNSCRESATRDQSRPLPNPALAELQRFPAYDHPPFTCYIWWTGPALDGPVLLEFFKNFYGTDQLWRISEWHRDWSSRGNAFHYDGNYISWDPKEDTQIIHDQYKQYRPGWGPMPVDEYWQYAPEIRDSLRDARDAPEKVRLPDDAPKEWPILNP